MTRLAIFRTYRLIWPNTILAILVFSQFATNASAHDLGVSSLNLNFSNQELVIYSSYARADLTALSNSAHIPIRKLAQRAIDIEVDGKKIKVESIGAFTDNADGVVFEHNFGEFSGSSISIDSSLLRKLGRNHRQILTITRKDDKEYSRQILRNDDGRVNLDLKNLQTPNSFGQFLALGIEHIIIGFDHLLFLLAFLLVANKTREILGIITFFTIAHSITLSLVTLNLVTVPDWIVEPIIALSIIYVGIENLLKREHNYRWLIAYAFGLIHGLGFASILRNLGIGSGWKTVSPLLSFNLGVEIGQIAIILLVLPILWKLQKSSAYENRIVPIGSILISIAGAYWLIERTLF